MELKYQSQIDAFSPSFEGFEEVDNRPAYRWVFEDIKNERNFLPVPLANPNNKRKITTFKFWALSFYEKEEQAKAELLRIASDKAEMFKKLGTHVAKGTINTPHGLCEIKCDDVGHFDHFEYTGVDFSDNNFIVGDRIAPAL